MLKLSAPNREHSPSSGEATPTRRSGRRRFLGLMGASGLGAAAAVFGPAGEAQALCSKYCCDLAVCPNITYAKCAENDYYTWGCRWSGKVICYCCESNYGGYQRSAYKCVSYN